MMETIETNRLKMEAVSALVDWALRQPGVVRIRAEAEASNAASLRVLEKAGFTPTGESGEEGIPFERRNVVGIATRRPATELR